MTLTKRWQRYQSYLDTGDWHVHSSYADGESSIAECCRQAESNGLELIAFTEHVRKKLDYSYEEFSYGSLIGCLGCFAIVLDYCIERGALSFGWNPLRASDSRREVDR